MQTDLNQTTSWLDLPENLDLINQMLSRTEPERPRSRVSRLLRSMARRARLFLRGWNSGPREKLLSDGLAFNPNPILFNPVKLHLLQQRAV